MSKSNAAERRRIKKLMDGQDLQIQALKDAGVSGDILSNLEKSREENRVQYEALAPKKSKSKYNAKKMLYRGEYYDSHREAKLAQALDRYGVQYQRQIQFELIPKESINGKELRARVMKTDFVVQGSESGIIIDVKGVTTALSKMKYRLLMHLQGDNYQYLFPDTDEGVLKLAAELGASLGSNPDGDLEVEEIKKPEPPKDEKDEKKVKEKEDPKKGKE